MKIAFYKGHGNWMDFLIRLKTRGMYSHTELIFCDGFSFSSSQWDGGTRFKKIKYDDFHWVLIEIPLSNEEEKKIRKFCEQQNNKPYDWKAIILAQIFNFYDQSAGKWFCSEICTKALQQIKLLVGAFMVSPQKMYEMLLDEELVLNRAQLKLRYEKNKRQYFGSFWHILYTSFAVWILLFLVSFFIDHPPLKAFLSSLF